jgi:hypothetical protein
MRGVGVMVIRHFRRDVVGEMRRLIRRWWRIVVARMRMVAWRIIKWRRDGLRIGTMIHGNRDSWSVVIRRDGGNTIHRRAISIVMVIVFVCRRRVMIRTRRGMEFMSSCL